MKLLFLYPNASSRSKVSVKYSGSYGKGYLFYGAEEAPQYGHTSMDHLAKSTRIEKSLFRKFFNKFLNTVIRILGGSGGDWYKLLCLRSEIGKADVIIATADRVGIPLVVLSWLKIIPKKSTVYISIGLPERLAKLNRLMFWFYQKAFYSCANHIICYGYGESLRIKSFLPNAKRRINFFPFGVGVDYFHPNGCFREKGDYILSIGADKNRDFELLLSIASQITSEILIITTQQRLGELANKFETFPDNVRFQTDVPFVEIKNLLFSSRFVVLPVIENSYSGATTTLLQAMSMEKAVIISKTSAIESGYFLQDKKNCLLVEPSDGEELLSNILKLLDNKPNQKSLGVEARKTIKQHLSWVHYTNNLYSVIDSNQEI
jgi:glycosyltransferase involved in cell wall biosynthesis